MNLLLWEDFKPNPRLVTKCRLRAAVFVPAVHLHPKAGLAEELELLGALLELLGSFPREKIEMPFRREGICFRPREVRDGRGGFSWCLIWSRSWCQWHWGGRDVPLLLLQCGTNHGASASSRTGVSQNQQLLGVCLLLDKHQG